MTWKCNCKLINAGVNNRCAGINHFTNVKHHQVSPTQYDITFYWVREAERSIKQLTDQEDKFANFFNAEAILVATMDDGELMEHIQELEEIAFEAKARLTAAKTGQRDRSAKKRLGGEWSITDVNPVVGDKDVSNTINKVQLRKKRMSKLDSTREKLLAIGLDDKTVDQMISKMLSQAKKDDASKPVIDVGIVPEELRESRKAEKAALDKKDAEDSSKEEKAKTEAENQSIKVEPVIEQIKESQSLDLSTLKFS